MTDDVKPPKFPTIVSMGCHLPTECPLIKWQTDMKAWLNSMIVENYWADAQDLLEKFKKAVLEAFSK